MTTSLIRNNLRPLYEAAQDAHPGLLLQRGLPEHREGDNEAKTRHIARVCGGRRDKEAEGKGRGKGRGDGRSHGRSAARTEGAGKHDADGFYRRAYGRWKQATSDAMRFRSVVLKLETRLFIGLAGGGMLETGCAIGHSHGAPYIPGSSVKGVVNACARERLDAARTEDGEAVCDELFGAPATEAPPAGLSGLITFHDAWWVPGSDDRPLAPEIVTTHHPDYYRHEGRSTGEGKSTAPTDFDSPIPNAQVAVHGAFLFVIEGPPGWLVLAEQMLIAALSTRGAGAKTRTGYGLFEAPIAAAADAGPRCEWVDTTLAALADKHNAKEEDILRGRPLAQAWDALEDPALKREAFSDIRSRWQEKEWWDEPPQGRSAEKARAIYDGYSAADDTAR